MIGQNRSVTNWGEYGKACLFKHFSGSISQRRLFFSSGYEEVPITEECYDLLRGDRGSLYDLLRETGKVKVE